MDLNTSLSFKVALSLFYWELKLEQLFLHIVRTGDSLYAYEQPGCDSEIGVSSQGGGKSVAAATNKSESVKLCWLYGNIPHVWKALIAVDIFTVYF